MNHGDGDKCSEAAGETFPADDQSAVLPLEPRKRPLGLKARDVLFHGAPTRLSMFPDSFGDLGADTPFAKAMAKVFGIIALIRGQHLESFTRSAPLTRVDVQRVQQWEDLGPLVPIGGRGAYGQRHARGIRETMDEDALAFPAIGHALTIPFARGTRNHPPRRIATESSRVPRRARGGALA